MNRTVLLILAIMTFLGSLPLAAHGEATFGLLAAALLLLGTGLSILVAVTPRKSSQLSDPRVIPGKTAACGTRADVGCRRMPW
jgi:hypothetical protein